MEDPKTSRRALLRFLLASPVLLSSEARAIERLLGEDVQPDPSLSERLIAGPDEAVNVFDYQRAAQHALSPGHYAYLSLGVDHEVTLRANRTGFEHFALRPRRLVDTRDIDTSLELFGTRLSSPIVLAPCGHQGAFHADAELAVARAAREQGHLQVVSTFSSKPLAEIARARGEPVWFQLYAFGPWILKEWLLSEAEDAGCPVVLVTVDNLGDGENRDRIEQFRRDDNPQCQPCHGGIGSTAGRLFVKATRAVGLDPRELVSEQMVLDWSDLDRIRKSTQMKVLVKGILTHEDARLCVERGVDGIVVSNHGGRGEDSGLSTIEVLPEIADAVNGRIPILIDGGFRRGTDFVKAMALGASAVCIGRPYLWGLSAFGQPGVEGVLDLLQRELVMAMRATGTPSLAAITAAHAREVPCLPDPG